MRPILFRLRIYPGVLLAVLALGAFVLTYLAPVSYANSDPQLSLVVSQSILEHGTIALDAYRGRLQLTVPFDQLVEHGMMQNVRGNFYYLFPPGPSVFALPAVFVANLGGGDMTIFAHNQWVQNVLAASLCALTVLLAYGIARAYLPTTASLIIATITVFGSALVSTMGTAYWNTNLAVLFILLSLWLIALLDSGRVESINGYVLGLLLFSAYFCRPTAAIFIALVLLYLLRRDRRTFVQAASSSFACFVLFLLWSRAQYGLWFPLYYRPARLQMVKGAVPVAVYGLLLSPSRGLLVYSPFFLVTFAGLAFTWRRVWRRPLFWLALFWFVLHLPIPGRSTRWWGGHSFGPRLLTEVIPALLLITIFVWESVRDAQERKARTLRVAGATLFIALGAIGIFINSGRGLYSHMPSLWNMTPNVDRYPQKIFDWRYPQFMATTETLQARYAEHVRAQWREGSVQLAAYVPGEPMAGEADPASVFVGWQQLSDGTWLVQTRSPVILFPLAQLPEKAYQVRIMHRSFQEQTVPLFVNGTHIGDLLSRPEWREDTFAVSATVLQKQSLNELSFAVPAPYVPAVGYLRAPHFQFSELRLEVAPVSAAESSR